ncbi:MAG TPA: hypothetical protein VG125_27170 [Pirellulales bacterium]|jgi:hypothetical protein|nr:hypothetical protein [Pirellulales bacterium]
MSTFASSLRHQPETSALIERQIQRWLLLQQAQAESDKCKSGGPPSRLCGHVINVEHLGVEGAARPIADAARTMLERGSPAFSGESLSTSRALV